jgi:hypothetical protein
VATESQLLQVVHALAPSRRLASGLDGREKQRDQDRDDRDHNEKLDQGKTATLSVSATSHF